MTVRYVDARVSLAQTVLGDGGVEKRRHVSCMGIYRARAAV